ncbi:MAG: 5-oxoprolinase subunit PxpB [Eudoraea sp.]|nr:5-oxoprolinase subunit PxpB [Eudoraea sp.]NNK30065.1 5-oxoprolinase subunit PxpB [Flavobacteriaceae bacterium]
MGTFKIQVRSFGERAILVTWPNRVDETLLDDIIAFRMHLQQKVLKSAEWEFVPAYNSLTIINNDTAIELDQYEEVLMQAYATKRKKKAFKRTLWKLPVCYDPSFGIDLEEVAEALETSTEEIIRLHTDHTYILYGIGFLPGFMYLGGLPNALEVPRKSTPRLEVPKGSVGLAGKQTGVYPQQSPGGWNIIGKCPIPIFNVEKEQPCFVQVGDRIQFYSITKDEYKLHKIEAKVGIYNIEKRNWSD